MLIRRQPHTYPGHWRDFLGALLSRDWRDGPGMLEFEAAFSEQLRTDAVCTSFGLHALAVILKYHGFADGAELLVPGYTAGVVKKCLDEMKVKRVYVDIDPQTGNMCPADFISKVSGRTKGVLVTHLFGSACSPSLLAAARDKGLIIIEDCAHAQGARGPDGMLGTLGHAGFFSFSYSKIINTYTGGMLVTGDPLFAAYARAEIASCPPYRRRNLLRKFLMGHIENLAGIPWITRLISPLLGSPTAIKWVKERVNMFTRRKMTSFYRYTHTQAVLGKRQLAKLEETLNARRRTAEYVMSRTSVDYLSKSTGDVYYNLIAIVPDAAHYHRELLKRGIDTGISSSVMEVIGPEEELPGCREANSRYLLLPSYPSLSTEDLCRLVDALNEVHASYPLH